MAAFGSLAADRLQLYREDMRRLGVIDRVKYLASKLHLLSGLIGNSNAFKGAQRELNQIEVYRANLLALDRYRRQPLNGRLRAFEIFETRRPGRVKVRDGIDWQALWKGPIKQHEMPGKDSGDMLSGENAVSSALHLHNNCDWRVRRLNSKIPWNVKTLKIVRKNCPLGTRPTVHLKCK